MRKNPVSLLRADKEATHGGYKRMNIRKLIADKGDGKTDVSPPVFPVKTNKVATTDSFDKKPEIIAAVACHDGKPQKKNSGETAFPIAASILSSAGAGQSEKSKFVSAQTATDDSRIIPKAFEIKSRIRRKILEKRSENVGRR